MIDQSQASVKQALQDKTGFMRHLTKDSALISILHK